MDNSEYFEGQGTRVTEYDYALSAEEMQTLYEKDKSCQ